ncbi:zf-HC2 domain-containing protein [Saccharothrix xinjiangensis]|uniref:Anti-sigma factor family protein n=1 Tax=Saccharothrix xinjiangensis TaxID=204798 RepID=A0ABV9XT72_9PSEU
MSCTRTVSLGAYLLGSLDPAERAGFERHVSDCAGCRREMVRLAPLPGLLGQVRLEDLELPFDDPEPEPALWPLPAEPEPGPARRRVRRPVLVGAALVLVLLGAVLLIPRLPGGDPAGVTWQATDPSSGAAADVELVAKSWGTELWMTLRDLPEDARCALVVHDRAGRTEIGGWWGTGHPEDERIPGSTSFGVDEIERVDVVVDKRVLVSVRP